MVMIWGRTTVVAIGGQGAPLKFGNRLGLRYFTSNATGLAHESMRNDMRGGAGPRRLIVRGKRALEHGTPATRWRVGLDQATGKDAA
jgi:hypothetical protein